MRRACGGMTKLLLFERLRSHQASPRDGKGRVFQVGIPSRREIGTGQSDSFPVPWSRRERDGKGREMPRYAKKLQITLKVIVKAIISYLILSINLFGFSAMTSLGSGTVGKGRDGK